MCSTDVDLDRTTFWAYSKHFQSPGPQGDWLCLQDQPWHCKVVSNALGPISTQIYWED